MVANVIGNRLRIREIGTQSSAKCQPDEDEFFKIMQEMVGGIQRKGSLYGNR